MRGIIWPVAAASHAPLARLSQILEQRPHVKPVRRRVILWVQPHQPQPRIFLDVISRRNRHLGRIQPVHMYVARIHTMLNKKSRKCGIFFIFYLRRVRGIRCWGGMSQHDVQK